MKKKTIFSGAMGFILLMGLVSLFSDMTHEGASSIYGVYLGMLGLTGATIGFISGFGEFLGYSLRILAGYISDKTKQYWNLTIIGYAIDVFAIPMLALVPKGGWQFAVFLILMERVGKAIKKPSKNALVSFAATQIGEGKSFAYLEFIDQIGAFLGPVMLYIVLALNTSSITIKTYALCFGILGIPAVITISLLLLAKRKFPNPENFEPSIIVEKKSKFSKSFILYIIAISLFAFGFIDFPLITYHISKEGLFATEFLPLLYAAAMIFDAFSALVFGSLFDKKGVSTLVVSTFISMFFPIFIFILSSKMAVFVGVILWGIGMGAQETILKSAVTIITPKQNRSMGFSVFETSFGLFWFLGSALLGFLYDANIALMVIVSILAQGLSIPLFFSISRSK